MSLFVRKDVGCGPVQKFEKKFWGRFYSFCHCKGAWRDRYAALRYPLVLYFLSLVRLFIVFLCVDITKNKVMWNILL